MAVADYVKAFFASIPSFIMSKIPSISQSQSSASSSLDLESQTVDVPTNAQQNRNQFLLHWQNAVMAFCFSTALEIAVLFAQIQSQLPVSFHVLSFAILLIFLSLFLASIIGHNFTVPAKCLEIVAGLLVSTTVVFTIAIPLPLSLKWATWVLYAISLFTVVICKACGF